MSDLDEVIAPSSVINATKRAAVGEDVRWRPKLWRVGRRIVVGSALLLGDFVSSWLALEAVRVLVALTFGHGLRDSVSILPNYFLLLIYLTLGLYFGAGQSPYERFRLRGIGTCLFVALGFVATATISMAAFLGISACLILLLAGGFYSELLVRNLLIRFDVWQAPTALVGCGAAAHQLYTTLVGQPELGLKPVGFLRTLSANDDQATGLPLPVLGYFDQPADFDASFEVAVLTSRDQLEMADRYSAQYRATQLVLLNDVRDIQTLWLRPRMLGNAVGLQFKRDPYFTQNRALKRFIDVAIALPAAILTGPLVAILAILIKIYDPGHAFYVQPRVGRGGRIINVPKLRTMYADSQSRLDTHLASNPGAKEEWERYFKLSQDPRILPILGQFIRRTSLDEIPQLWSIIVGDMSLVGPRPFPSYHLQGFDAEFQKLRASVPPGLTGLWQVSARSNGDLGVQKDQDSFYIRNWSLWLDLYILLQTVPAVLSAHGAK
jgi:Undecaprenyl-phosphate galactose phosphotransferase WbaP